MPLFLLWTQFLLSLNGQPVKGFLYLSLLDQQLESIFCTKCKETDLLHQLVLISSFCWCHLNCNLKCRRRFLGALLASDTGSACLHSGLHVFLFIHIVQKGLWSGQYLAYVCSDIILNNTDCVFAIPATVRFLSTVNPDFLCSS